MLFQKIIEDISTTIVAPLYPKGRDLNKCEFTQYKDASTQVQIYLAE